MHKNCLNLRLCIILANSIKNIFILVQMQTKFAQHTPSTMLLVSSDLFYVPTLAIPWRLTGPWYGKCYHVTHVV